LAEHYLKLKKTNNTKQRQPTKTFVEKYRLGVFTATERVLPTGACAVVVVGRREGGEVRRRFVPFWEM